MKLQYYAPAVAESYCVGIHNGHGLGSVFARLFSKIAAKTAAKAAAKVTTAAGKKALKVVVNKGAQLGKKALNVAQNQGVKVIKKYGKKAISKAGKAASKYALEKINTASEKAINKGLPPEAVHSIKDTLERGVKSAQVDVTNAALKKANILVDKASSSAYKTANKYIDKNVEKVTGQPLPSKVSKPVRKKSQKFSSKIADRKRKTPTFSGVSAKKKRPINIQNIIEEA